MSSASCWAEQQDPSRAGSPPRRRAISTVFRRSREASARGPAHGVHGATQHLHAHLEVLVRTGSAQAPHLAQQGHSLPVTADRISVVGRQQLRAGVGPCVDAPAQSAPDFQLDATFIQPCAASKPSERIDRDTSELASARQLQRKSSIETGPCNSRDLIVDRSQRRGDAVLIEERPVLRVRIIVATCNDEDEPPHELERSLHSDDARTRVASISYVDEYRSAPSGCGCHPRTCAMSSWWIRRPAARS